MSTGEHVGRPTFASHICQVPQYQYFGAVSGAAHLSMGSVVKSAVWYFDDRLFHQDGRRRRPSGSVADVRAKARRLSCMGDHDAQDSEEINCSFEREVGRVNRKSGAPRPQGIDPQRPESRRTVDDDERQSRPSS